jgi:hypothetical protein
MYMYTGVHGDVVSLLTSRREACEGRSEGEAGGGGKL